MSGPIERFLGPWHLSSHRYRDDQGAWKDSGKGGQGLLIYTPEGFMSVAISWADVDGAPSRLFYSGRYELLENAVIHEIWHSNQDWRLNQKLRRDFRFEGQELVLEGKTSFGFGEIRWKKAST